MDLDLETFLTTLYVRVDDLYQQAVRPQMPPQRGPAPKLSDSEVLCLGLAAQWRSGVPWKSERGFGRYALKLLQQAAAQELTSAQDYEVMDCEPVPVARGARSFHPGWLADIARIGKGGNDRYFYGLHLLVVASASGVATGWMLAAGNIQDRWLAEGLFSARAGCPQLTGPALPGQALPRLPAPTDWLGPAQSCGRNIGRSVVADRGFAAEDWCRHWAENYTAQVVAPPEAAPPATRRWFSGLRQVIETVFSHLDSSFGLKYPGAHTTWGLLTRVAAKLAAYNLGIWINRYCGRPDFAFPTLIV